MNGGPLGAEAIESIAIPLIHAVDRAGGTLRLHGSAACILRCAIYRNGTVQRHAGDLDLVLRTKNVQACVDALLGCGLSISSHHWMHAESRIFLQTPHGVHVDVSIDRLRYSHDVYPFAYDDSHPVTVGGGALLIEKLQVVRFEMKDRIDASVLLASFQFEDSAKLNAIGLPAFCSFASSSWGLYHTVETNLVSLLRLIREPRLPEYLATVVEARAQELLDALSRTPKNLSFRIRGAIGERLPWHLPAEESSRGADQ